MSSRPRVVVPEILDGLPHDDPDAIASRRDLRRVNAVMGNPRWILDQARVHVDIAQRGITEIGAGDGRLAMRLAREYPESRVTAIDLAPAPAGGLPVNLQWRRQNLLDESFDHPPVGLLVVCLILHHFEATDLARLGRNFVSHFDAIAIVEPNRCQSAHLLGWLAWPFINRVTRHDMHVSINAGFAKGELAELLEMSRTEWKIDESCTITGARRWLARRLH